MTPTHAYAHKRAHTCMSSTHTQDPHMRIPSLAHALPLQDPPQDPASIPRIPLVVPGQPASVTAAPPPSTADQAPASAVGSPAASAAPSPATGMDAAAPALLVAPGHPQPQAVVLGPGGLPILQPQAQPPSSGERVPLPCALCSFCGGLCAEGSTRRFRVPPCVQGEQGQRLGG